jgi:hypothetical protein
MRPTRHLSPPPFRSFERWVGPIPYGFHVHHVCRNSLCANPDHLEAISAGDHWRIRTKPPT